MNAVAFNRVSKSYPIYAKPGDRLKELAAAGMISLHRDFPALTDVSFQIRRGEVFCIIGENGSGKSTTLQLIAGILTPTSGSVEVNGRVAALLELGAGFNPEFSGRDNLYLNAALFGLTKAETDRKLPLIEAFAEIGEFIDRPVRTYSTGMALRLAFAVAIHVDPEILVVDEALAVGDAYFRHRCMRRIQELRDAGVTIIFVSHSVADVKAIGERAVWLRRGRVQAVGDIDAVVAKYLAAMTSREETELVTTAPGPVLTIPNIDSRSGDRRAEILGIAVNDAFGDPLHLMIPGCAIVVRMTIRAHDNLNQPDAGVLLRNHLGLDFAEARLASPEPIEAGEQITFEFRIEIPELYPGAFSFSPFITSDGSVCDRIENAVTVQMARGEGIVYGCLHVPCRVELESSAARVEATVA